MGFAQGQPVTWYYTPRGGWGWEIPVRATVVKVNKKTVTIDAELEKGGSVRRNVKPDKLKVKQEE
jgi:hypothetical protein